MALLTSLYLCSRTVYAAVGTPTGSGARVVAAAQTELPEGCLINGVITNEADLTAALKEFFTANKLPMNRVALIAGGSQFMHRILTLPAMSEKKRMAVLSHELASGGAEVRAPLDDYMLLSRDARTRVDTVLATRVEQSVIAGYDALAKAVGFKLYSIDLGLAAPIKAVRTIPDLQQKTFVLLQFDDDTISACLFVQGQYTYSTRSRLFNPRGSAESCRTRVQPGRTNRRSPRRWGAVGRLCWRSSAASHRLTSPHYGLPPFPPANPHPAQNTAAHT